MQLLMVALKEEVAGMEFTHEQKLAATISLYDVAGFPDLKVCITGPLEHQVAAACSLLMSQPFSIQQIINFGSCGIYPNGQKCLALLQTVCISHVAKHDQSIPIPGYNTFLSSFQLCSHPSIQHLSPAICLTGASFSSPTTNHDFASQSYPSLSSFAPTVTKVPAIANECGIVEDMELYTLASICFHLDIPLIAIKYITNPCTEDGGHLFEQNLMKARQNATQHLLKLINHL